MTIRKIAVSILSLFLAFALVSCTPAMSSNNKLVKIAEAKGIPEASENDSSCTQGKEENYNRDSGKNVDSIILNTSSKKIHLSIECTYAKSMIEANKAIDTKDKLEEYLENGYLICSNCNKKYNADN